MQRWNSAPIALYPKPGVPPSSAAGRLLQHTFRTGQAHAPSQHGISIHGFALYAPVPMANHRCDQGHVLPGRPFLPAQRREQRFGPGSGPRIICGEAEDPGLSVEMLILLRGSS